MKPRCSFEAHYIQALVGIKLNAHTVSLWWCLWKTLRQFHVLDVLVVEYVLSMMLANFKTSLNKCRTEKNR